MFYNKIWVIIWGIFLKEILLNNKNEWTISSCNIMDENYRHHAEWNKLDTKRMLTALFYLINFKTRKTIYEQQLSLRTMKKGLFDYEETFREWWNVIISVEICVTQMYAFMKTHQPVHWRSMHYTVCKIYLNKVIKVVWWYQMLVRMEDYRKSHTQLRECIMVYQV